VIIKELYLQNFIGYRGEHSISFAGKDKIGIVGVNESGKSSLLHAIFYALYGKSHAKREVDLISSGSREPLLVHIVVELPDKTELSIYRGRTTSNEPILKVDGYNGKPSDLNAIISSILPINYQDFLALTYFVQGDIHGFMSGNKREYFKRWTSNLGLWEMMRKDAEKRLSVVKEKIIILQAKIDGLKELIATKDVLQNYYSFAQNELGKVKLELEVVDRKYSKLSAELQLKKPKDEIVAEIEQLLSDLRSKNAAIDRTEEDLCELDEKVIDIDCSICPLLHVDCDKLDSEAEKLKSSLKKRIDSLEQDIKRRRKSCFDLKNKILQLEVSCSKDEYEDLRRQLSYTNDRLTRIKEEKEVAFKKLVGFSCRLEAISKAEQELSSLEDKLDSVEEERKQLSFISYMCSKNGIPSLIIAQELKRVENKCNFVLEKLTSNKRLIFDHRRELASYEKLCPFCGNESWKNRHCMKCGRERPKKTADELNVRILDGGIERPFELESGGAKVLHSFAARLACSLFISNITGQQMNLIMLDETFAMLDLENRQKLLSLVVDRLDKEFGIKQQFIVSHLNDVTDSVNHLLHVRKEHGCSVACWE
jgi:exonuclease SbcC